MTESFSYFAHFQASFFRKDKQKEIFKLIIINNEDYVSIFVVHSLKTSVFVQFVLSNHRTARLNLNRVIAFK